MSFDDYCHDMVKDGRWGGNVELQAASIILNSIWIHIDDNMSPLYTISNNNATQIIHL